MEDEYARWFAFDPRPIVVTPKFFEACLQTGELNHDILGKKNASGRPAHVAIKR